jgi:hypothetical protein
MTPKQKRTVDHDLALLFSPKAFITNPTIDEVKPFGFFRPSIEINRTTLFLSQGGITALKRLSRVIGDLPELCDLVSKSEIANQLAKSHNAFIS